MKERIIQSFYNSEYRSKVHSDEYLDEIVSVNSLEELVDIVTLWVGECEGDKGKAALYILNKFDK